MATYVEARVCVRCSAYYARFGKDKVLNFSIFKPSGQALENRSLKEFGQSAESLKQLLILYALAAPSTPEAVIDKAVAKAESGDKVTVADIKDWKVIESELESERKARIEARA